MRCVTEKPPMILILVIKIANADKYMMIGLSDDIWVTAPSMMILLIALVILIKGVCSVADTFQITM